MNKMLDKEDFTMMKRAIFATQVWFPLNRQMAITTGSRGPGHVSSEPRDCWEFCFLEQPSMEGSILRSVEGAQVTGRTSVPRSRCLSVTYSPPGAARSRGFSGFPRLVDKD
jgi:hypothetical protein